MLQGIDNKETIEFVSTTDTAENPTVFLLGNISNKDKLNLFADAIDRTGAIDMSKMSGRIFDIAKAGLKGIKNLSGKDYATIDDAVLETIPFNVVLELVNKIVEINFLGVKQEKN
jgi:hypothetical protein